MQTRKIKSQVSLIAGLIFTLAPFHSEAFEMCNVYKLHNIRDIISCYMSPLEEGARQERASYNSCDPKSQLICSYHKSFMEYYERSVIKHKQILEALDAKAITPNQARDALTDVIDDVKKEGNALQSTWEERAQNMMNTKSESATSTDLDVTCEKTWDDKVRCSQR